MKLSIREVRNKKDLRRFVAFPYLLYRSHPLWVPPLRREAAATLDPERNPAFEYCETALWLAESEGRVVGRIAAFINHKFVETWHSKTAGFGWFDLVDDQRVAGALLGRAESWAAERGMTSIQGPMGLTNFDQQGLLVEGFTELPTVASTYNFPYYLTHLEAHGYVKVNDYLEYEVIPPKTIPEKIQRISELVLQRNGVRLLKVADKKELMPYAREVFQIINTTYSHLFAYVPLTERQVEYYSRKYFPYLRPEFVSMLIEPGGRLIGFQITMPSLSRAMQKARGRLLPFGWLHLLRAMKRPKTIDLYLVGILPEYQNRGLNAAFMVDLNRITIENGIEKAETNSEQEDNKKIQDFWKHYQSRQHKRKRVLKKELTG